MSVRILALLAIAAAFAPSTASAGLFGRGCCSPAPSCGCDVAPSCGCEVAPSCGCEIAPSCDPCARPRLFGKLFSKLHSAGSCCDAAPSCGCEVAPSCCAPAPVCCAPAPAPVCCAPAPSCGCEVSVCDPCAAPRHHKLLGGLKSRLGGFKGCFSAPSCGCDVAPSCGCDAAPSCGCGM